MSALSKIESAGFILKLVDGNLNVTPTLAALTDKQRIFLKEHKAKIIGDLKKMQCQDVIYTPDGENEFIDVHDIHHVHAKMITCGKCLNFKPHYPHGKGSGFCLADSDSRIWSDSLHECQQFNAVVEGQELPEPKPGAIIVICYAPNGKPIEVEARDAKHAAWLKQMNPAQERGIK